MRSCLLMCPAPQVLDVLAAGGLGLRKALSPQATRNLIRLGSKRAEALEVLTAQVAELQNTLQVCPPPPSPPCLQVSTCCLPFRMPTSLTLLSSGQVLQNNQSHSTDSRKTCIA